MKKLVLSVCAVMLFVLVVCGGQKKANAGAAPEILSVTEAAFSIRNSDCEDVTDFLVGRFAGENGRLLCFDGQGEVKEVASNLVTQTGSCTLTESEDGAAVLRIVEDGAVKLYSFKVYSPEGGFILTDENGKTETFTPVI